MILPPECRRNLADRHFADAPLGDPRRSQRLVRIARELVTRPHGTLPHKIPDPHQLDAAYDFFKNPHVRPDAIPTPHRNHVRDELAKRNDPIVLIPHDDTDLNFTSLDIPNLGVLPGQGQQRGLIAHNSLAITPRNQILGLLHQILHTAKPAPKSDTKSKSKNNGQKNSCLWRDALEVIGSPPAGQRWIHLADRAADITEFLDYADEHGLEYVVRANHDRNVKSVPEASNVLENPGDFADDADRVTQKMFAAIGSRPVAGTFELVVGATVQRKARTTTVAVRWAEVMIQPPRQARGRERGVPLRVTVVQVQEVNPPAGVEPIAWWVLTNTPVTDAASAWQVVQWYAKRWTVEEYHKCLKLGVSLECLELTTLAGIQNAVAVFSVVAVVLVQLREWSRDEATADRPIRDWVPSVWVDLLTAWRYPKGDGELVTVRDWIWALARLGGHQNKKHLGPPGWLTILRGWQQFQAMLFAWNLSKSSAGS